MLFSDEKGKISDIPPQVSLLDHGFLFGDSIYEVVRLYDGRMFGWLEHRRRMLESADRMRISLGEKLDNIEERAIALFQAFGKKDAALRIIMTRGIGKLNIDPRSCQEPQIFMAVWELKAEAIPTEVSICIPEIRRNSIRALDPAIKSGNYLNSILALREAIELGVDDSLMLNENDELTEMTTSNFGLVKNSQVFTPSLDSGILHGITRHFFSTQLQAGVQETKLKVADLQEAQELFILSTIKEVCPITRVIFPGGESRSYAIGDKTVELRSKFKAFVQESIAQQPAVV